MSHGLAIVLVLVQEKEAKRHIRRWQRRLHDMRLDGVRFRGKPTAKTWDHYEVNL
jgi:hypothetical protein